MSNCKCCGKEIDQVQMLYCGLCGLCDTGACQNPKRFHELERRIKQLEAIEYNNREERRK